MPDNVIKRKVLIFTAPKFVRAYMKNKRDAGHYTIVNDSQITPRIDFTNHILVGLPSMIGTTDMFATFKENILALKKRGPRATNFDLQKSDRSVKFLSDWYAAVGFGCNQLVWATEQTVAQTPQPTTPQPASSGSGS
jgi:hypothetical protein